MTQPAPDDTALAELKVLDLSRILAGPWSTQMLADLGADVVKVESPDGGDDTRKWGPPFLSNANNERSDAAYYACCNRNKRSVAIDFSTPEGASEVRALASRADILVENFRLGGLNKYGLDYDTLSEINPSLIYCSITGFGQDGPYANRAGYDLLMQGMGGLMSVTGQADGQPGAEPMKVGVAACDLFTGMNAVTAILAALNYRHRTGLGQHIDCALLDCQVSMLANQASNWLNGNVIPQRNGNNHPSVVPYRVFPASDGYMIVGVGNDRQFSRLCTRLNLSELIDNPRFATSEARLLNREEIDTLLANEFSRMKKADVITNLAAIDVPCGPINTIPEVFDDPQVQSRGLDISLERSDGTVVHTVAFPAKLSRSPASYRRAPPVLGEHHQEVFADWGVQTGC